MPAPWSRSRESRDQPPSPGPVQQLTLRHGSGISTQGIALAPSPVHQLPQHHQWPVDRPELRMAPQPEKSEHHLPLRSSRTNPHPRAARFCPKEIQAPSRITISRGSGTHLHTLLPGTTSTGE
ncbi:hypothetical protein NDU88_007337 [Pleurodeles waltl]|uniref:Uncharacterized protein n=1 Tax=Pleurodeles waltl TaxID=8319 RepID=A0AAV7VTI8_PLEWA|nr:hypothetical protein NDU88_007337 [Pleurodeles waltl]